MSLPDDAFDLPNCTVLRDSGKALLITAPSLGEKNGDDEVWVPKSVVHDDSEVFADDHEGTLLVKQWFAEDRGWL